MTHLEWGMLLLLSVLWGGSFFFTGIAVRELPPLTIVFLRVALAAVILLAALRAIGLPMPKSRSVWMAFFGMGVLNNVVPFCLIVWGQTHIASGLASILNATTPLFTVVVAHGLTTDEKMTGGRLAGVLLGLLGVVVIIGPAVLGTFGTNVLAQIAVLGAALSYAFAGIYGRRFKRMGIPAMATATGQVSASAIMLLPMVLVVDRPWTLPMPHMTTWAAMIGIAALSTALAYVLYFRLLASAGATNLLLVTFLIPVSAIVLGSLVLGETVQVKHVAGMLCIGLGLAAIDGRLWKNLRFGRAPSAPSSGARTDDPAIYQGRDI
ncbi:MULTISPECIES: DMT family transporter [unclassified Aureimonas]|uniref:DMT family transporter n=1 Tax=unclassified Aureimonas TaxID=2615206 RepID=UPI0006F5D2C9|nr:MULTISPECIES: DMT family transporter [unclassified Aureimonas]KQT59818.1 ABC transporter permease [Aureimonas sp. Leaf427]KQT62283.1 ABC transporter permease [Aureimonas sp. Leaf460]